MLWSKPKTISFAEAQRVLVTVLRDVRCNDWANKVSAASANSFRSLLGGMGSFNDVVICRANHHELATDREPLANELVDCMRSVCYATRDGAIAADAAIASCGTISLVLTGWRCLVCGHGQISSRGARSFVGAVEVRKALRDGINQRAPSDALLALWREPENFLAVRVLVDMARTSGIQYSEGEGWMRPCPGCGGNNTCVYRWKRDHDEFVPTADNLPLRIAKRGEEEDSFTSAC